MSIRSCVRKLFSPRDVQAEEYPVVILFTERKPTMWPVGRAKWYIKVMCQCKANFPTPKHRREEWERIRVDRLVEIYEHEKYVRNLREDVVELEAATKADKE